MAKFKKLITGSSDLKSVSHFLKNSRRELGNASAFCKRQSTLKSKIDKMHKSCVDILDQMAKELDIASRNNKKTKR